MPDDKPRKLTREDFESALQEIGTYIDVSVDDLMEITTKAQRHARLREQETRKVQALMSRSVQTVHPEATLAQAAHLLVEHGISGLPVVDGNDRLVGVITEADFLRAIGVPAHHPTHSLWQTLEAMFSPATRTRSPEGTVAELMVTDVVTLEPEQTLNDVVETMKRHRIKRIVVVDDRQRVVGMVTRSDLVRVFFDRMKESTSSP